MAPLTCDDIGSCQACVNFPGCFFCGEDCVTVGTECRLLQVPANGMCTDDSDDDDSGDNESDDENRAPSIDTDSITAADQMDGTDEVIFVPADGETDIGPMIGLGVMVGLLVLAVVALVAYLLGRASSAAPLLSPAPTANDAYASAGDESVYYSLRGGPSFSNGGGASYTELRPVPLRGMAQRPSASTASDADSYSLYDRSASAALSLQRDWSIDSSDISLGRKIGEGAFGVVYKAKWSSGATVAVKQLRLSLDDSHESSQSTLAMLARELSLMARLQPHWAVVQLFGTCQLANGLAVVLECMTLFEIRGTHKH